MVKALRVIVGLAFVALLLHGATLAVRDCATGSYLSDNCLWLWVRERLGLPQSKILRAAALEVVGLALLAALYLTIRYVFPRARRSDAPQTSRAKNRGSNPGSA